MGDDQPPSGHAGPRAGRPRGKPDGGRDRQPGRQDDREWRHPGLRWRQENQRPQTARDGGHRRAGLKLQAHAADVQDRDGAGPLLPASRPSWPFVEVAFADAGYQGPRVAAASPIRVEIVRKPEGQVGFTVHAKRWVVERFFAWINRNRRLAKNVEATIASAQAFLYAASAVLLFQRLGRREPDSRRTLRSDAPLPRADQGNGRCRPIRST